MDLVTYIGPKDQKNMVQESDHSLRASGDSRSCAHRRNRSAREEEGDDDDEDRTDKRGK
jgi:hypothetical protein